MLAMSMRFPGTAENDCVATSAFAGTRCSAALTVVSSTEGRSLPLRRDSRDSAVIRCATTPACGETRSYGRQSQAGNSSTATSGAKNASERASAAMRGPSRQTTSRLVAGAPRRAATARPRSAQARPSAPSVTPASVSGRPDLRRSAGEATNSALAVVAVIVAHSPEHWRIEVARNLGFAGNPGEQLPVGEVDKAFELVELGVIQNGDSTVGEAAHDQVHLAHAAVPGPEQELAAPDIQPIARTFGHAVSNAKNPDGPGEGHIATG